jgi:hypothetical protein
MKLLDIVHPAAKTLVDVSLAQDAEVGFVLWRVVRQGGKEAVMQRYSMKGGIIHAWQCVMVIVKLVSFEFVWQHNTAQCNTAVPLPPQNTHAHTHTKQQVGDGTTSVVILAGELLKEAKPFVEEGAHPRVGNGACLSTCCVRGERGAAAAAAAAAGNLMRMVCVLLNEGVRGIPCMHRTASHSLTACLGHNT